MDTNMKTYNSKEVIVSESTNTFPIKIVMFEDIKDRLPNSRVCVIKVSEDGTNYLAELHLIDNDYDLTEKLCFIYDELSDTEKKMYESACITISVKYPNIKSYKNKVKAKK